MATMAMAKNKSQGMYPTPEPLARNVVCELFSNFTTPPKALLEPSAGHGVFIVSAWDYWAKRLAKRQLVKLVEQTYAFENDKNTYRQLERNLGNWCRERKLKAKPKLSANNFLLDGAREDFPDGTTILGNPPWDEFTTRKHDEIAIAEIGAIRKQRTDEKMKFAPLGIRNLYQAFMHELLTLKCKHLSIGIILPRQILGDLNAKNLRSSLLSQGETFLSVYRNRDEPNFFFDEVDSNFQIISLIHSRVQTKKHNLYIRRGFVTDYEKILPAPEDLTIPCPITNPSLTTLRKVLEEETFGSWADKWGVTVSRGRVLPGDSGYKTSRNGRTISAYDSIVDVSKGKLLINKILPNSKRKVKAAVVGIRCPVSDSLLVIETPHKEALYPYLLLMLNSRVIELSLRALTSNINLNNFRLKSLPIPEPTPTLISKSKKLLEKAKAQRIHWEAASDELCRYIYSLKATEQKHLSLIFPDRSASRLPAHFPPNSIA